MNRIFYILRVHIEGQSPRLHPYHLGTEPRQARALAEDIFRRYRAGATGLEAFRIDWTRDPAPVSEVELISAPEGNPGGWRPIAVYDGTLWRYAIIAEDAA